jgi:DNA-binding transcriptional regulator YiaG
MNNLSPQEIKQARLMLGLSQEEFSKALGFSGKKQVVNRWESGARKPSQLTIEKIYKLFRERFEENKNKPLYKKLME